MKKNDMTHQAWVNITHQSRDHVGRFYSADSGQASDPLGAEVYAGFNWILVEKLSLAPIATQYHRRSRPPSHSARQ
jgi:hypothetical protein